LFEEFVAFKFVHFSGKINLGGINLVLSEFGGELGDDLFGNFVVKLLDFVELIHWGKGVRQMVKFIIILANL
jgi:hypothetical protein